MSRKLWVKLYDADGIDRAGLKDFFFQALNGATEQQSLEKRYYVVFDGELVGIPNYSYVKDTVLLTDPRLRQMEKWACDMWILYEIPIPGYSQSSGSLEVASASVQK